MGKDRKGKGGRNITEQMCTRVLASISSSSRGPDSSAVAVVNRNNSRDTAETTENTETAPDRRGMGQELSDNRVANDGTLPEIAKAGMEKEASSALLEKEKDTSDATVMTGEEPRNKSCNNREKKASETASDRREMCQEVTENKVPEDGTLPETAKATMGKEALLILPEKEKDTFSATTVTNLESEEPRSKSCNSREKKASETTMDRSGTGQEVIENKVPKDGTIPETAMASTVKRASSALPEKEKNICDATALTNLERKEPQSKSCTSVEEKALETAPDKIGTGQEAIENKVPTDGTLPQTEKGGMGKEASSALLEKEKDTSDATAVTNPESEEPQSKICNSEEKKNPEPALDRRGKGQKTIGKGRKQNRGIDITEQTLGTRVLAGIASSSRGQDYSALPVVNRNSSREAAQPTVNSETDQERRGMGQVLTDNRMLKDGTLPETTKAGMEKEASSVLPEKEKGTWDATTVTNLESEEPRSKSYKSGEKKVSESSINRTGMGHKVAKDSSLPESEKGSVGEEASANPEIRSQAGTGGSRNDVVQSASGIREEADDVITVPSPSADPDIYLPAFGSIRLRPWVPQSDGIEVCGASGERLSDEQTTESINLALYGANRGFESMQRETSNKRRIRGWEPKLIESDEEE